MSPPVTLVTGASSGIGRELCRRLDARGHRLIGVARRTERLAELESSLRAFEPELADLRHPSERSGLAARVLERHGAPDYLILNAGLAHYGRLERLSFDEVREQLEVNVAAVMDLTQRFLPAMLERGHGRILVISSVLGVGTSPYSAVYSATKHAVNGFVRGLRLDLHGTGVSISAVCPAGVRTEFSEVATAGASTRRPGQEPVERVVRGIVRKLDRDRTLVFPTLKAWWLAALLRFAPWVTDWFLASFGRTAFADRLPKTRRA